MNDPLIARFAEACGATAPLDLRVRVADGVLAEGTVRQPFTLVGRDDACDVTLNDAGVNPRHAWLQVVDGRVFAVDLGSRAGLVWPDGQSRSGWLDPGTPVRVGPFQVRLRSPVSARPPAAGRPPTPLQSNPALAATRPPVQLDFRNGKRPRDRWAVNRVITLIGRADACKLCLHADDIAAYHCGLVLTPAGLWVVDLSGRGVVVNGERMRVAPLPHGAELWVGRFLIGCHYSNAAAVPPATALRLAGPPTQLRPHPPADGYRRGRSLLGLPDRPVAEDEVPIGGMPPPEAASGLPSSHIMFDAFRHPTTGPVSAPILVSSPPPPPAPHRPVPAAPAPPPGDPAENPIAPLFKQLGEIHGHLLDQFRQSLVMMSQAVGQMSRGRVGEVQQELSRIQSLNGELADLQADITRLAMAQALGEAPPASLPRTVPGDTPLPEVHLAYATEAMHAWVEERIGALQKERRTHWERLTELIGADSPATTH